MNFMATANMTNMTDKLGSWNWNSSTKVALSVVEKKPQPSDQFPSSAIPIALVHVSLSLWKLIHQYIHLLSNLCFSPGKNRANRSFGWEFATWLRRYSFYLPRIDIWFCGTIWVSIIFCYSTPGDWRLSDDSSTSDSSLHLYRSFSGMIRPGLLNQSFKRESTNWRISLTMVWLMQSPLEMVFHKLKSYTMSIHPFPDEAPKSRCPFTFFGQIHPTAIPEHLMEELESELQNPTGVWTIPTPKLSISGLLLSKECGILYEVKNTEGLR